MSMLRRVTAFRNYSSASISPNWLRKIGEREVVGHGVNGQPSYQDRIDFPLPAIRFKPNTPDIKILREKEKGDWKQLSLAEKKALYRASFGQTLAEVSAPTGEWKSVVGWGLVFISLGLWLQMYIKLFVYDERDLPKSFSLESRQAQLRRMLAFRIAPVTGLSSKWDYEKDEWKK
uniref:Cytochrome c oxidase subunit 4 n=1 Tax=Riptortus pedestris TaxID=329032 RepID=R4WRG1_RIPPE|nr:cytochrome c oxidase subunit iv [Riptortus pedestris]